MESSIQGSNIAVRDHVRNLSVQLYQQISQMLVIFSHHLQQLAHNQTRTPFLQGSCLTVAYSLFGLCVCVKRKRTLYLKESSAAWVV
uniref:Uncharacterized protein n=1 Tax=Zea mays TaxID=4577 RepID=C0PLB0_MAIZE|nr:unknown [Zea mays]